jgi:hypothetical protein
MLSHYAVFQGILPVSNGLNFFRTSIRTGHAKLIAPRERAVPDRALRNAGSGGG